VEHLAGYVPDVGDETGILRFMPAAAELSDLTDLVLGLPNLPVRRISLREGDGSCFDDPAGGVTAISVNGLSDEEAGKALAAMKDMGYGMEGVDACMMKRMVQLCIYVHENVHGRLRALSNSSNAGGENRYQVLTGVDDISEGLAFFASACVLRLYADRLSEGTAGEDISFVKNAALIAERFDDLRPALSP